MERKIPFLTIPCYHKFVHTLDYEYSSPDEVGLLDEQTPRSFLLGYHIQLWRTDTLELVY